MSLLLAENIAKHFGGIAALDAARFELAAGEVHALMGENGAGKSTLARICAGSLRPDSGRIELEGREITGWPVMTIRRGEILAEWPNGEPKSKIVATTKGQYLARRPGCRFLV